MVDLPPNIPRNPRMRGAPRRPRPAPRAPQPEPPAPPEPGCIGTILGIVLLVVLCTAPALIVILRPDIANPGILDRVFPIDTSKEPKDLLEFVWLLLVIFFKVSILLMILLLFLASLFFLISLAIAFLPIWLPIYLLLQGASLRDAIGCMILILPFWLGALYSLLRKDD